MKPKHKSPFQHSYPDAEGVMGGGQGAGMTPHKHPYPAGGMGTTRSDGQGAAGPSGFMHPVPKAMQPGMPANLKGTKKPPLTHRLKKRNPGGVHHTGK